MAVQRGDAEMAQKLWRVVRACVELGPGNPIQQIHDQGAGGNCNVVRPLREQGPCAALFVLTMLQRGCTSWLCHGRLHRVFGGIWASCPAAALLFISGC